MDTQAPESASTSCILFECTIEMPYGHYSKKNSKSIGRGRNGKPFIRTNDKYAAIERYVLQCLQGRKLDLHYHESIQFPVSLVLNLQCDSCLTKKGVISRTGGDLDNLIQGPIDCLVKAQILADDSLVTRLTATKSHGENSISIRIYRDGQT